MSTITTTPAPQINRTPLLVGIAAVGVVAVCAVVVPRLASTVGSSATTGTAESNAVITQHDLVEHRADVAGSIENARISSAVERQLTHQGKVLAGSSTGLATAALVPRSAFDAQVGGLHPTYAYRPATLAAVGLTSTLRQQVGGLAPTFEYTPATHTRWTDTFVPPYDDPEWMPVIKRHYAGSFTTPATHEFR